MKKRVFQLVVLLIFAMSPALGWTRDVTGGKPGAACYHPLITVVEGDVKVKGTRYSVWEPAEVGTLLLSGDIIKTGAGASAEVRFLSGEVQLYENSVMIIPSTGVQLRKKDIEEVIVEDGSVLFDINPLGVKRGFEFRTRNVQGGVKGTLFTVTYRDENTSINVYRGTVAVSDRNRNKETRVELKAGRCLSVREKADFHRVKTFDPSTSLEDYNYNVPPGLDGRGLPSDNKANPANKGVRKRGNSKSESSHNTSESVNTVDKSEGQSENQK